jgi:dolichol-phosphate mannosyltransferase
MRSTSTAAALLEREVIVQAPSSREGVRLSIVAPCYNEEEGLLMFVERMVAAARSSVGSDFELILVNDGSRDRTMDRMLSAARANPEILCVDLARNHGHQLAVTAGLSLIRGERVLVIDADLQDPPELLSQMLTVMDGGYDVVFGRRRTRASESRFKLATASMFYRVLNRLSEVEIPNDTGDFRLMSRRIVDRLNEMPEHDRFLRGMVAWLGGRQTEMLYDRDARYAGTTGYTLSKMIALAVNGLTGFSTAPLKTAVVLATMGMVIAFGIVAYTLIGFFVGKVSPGWTSLALMISFFGVGQFGCMAIIGSYVGRSYMQVKGRPLFLINDLVSFKSPSQDQS